MGSGKKWHTTCFSFKTIAICYIYIYIYINDLPDNVTFRIKLFADHSKIYSTIKDTTDTLSLQNNLDIVNEWSYKWLLNFNAEKCKLLQLGNSSPVNYYLSNPDNLSRSLISAR